MNNTTPASLSALFGTKTHENLKKAFEKEAEAYTKSAVFSSLAKDNGDISAMHTLSEHAENDKKHAELWMGYLDELGDTDENLSLLFSLKENMNNDIYPFMAEIADKEGFDEIAEKMRLVSAVKAIHKDALNDERKKLSDSKALYSNDPETIWHCTSCGYNIKGNLPPERCPLCSYPQSYYSKG